MGKYTLFHAHITLQVNKRQQQQQIINRASQQNTWATAYIIFLTTISSTASLKLTQS